jgi:hypothetical protein
MKHTDLIAGEPRTTLVEAIRLLRFDRLSSTLGRLHGDMGRDVAAAFLRAFHRVEGEVLYLDAERQAPNRTREQLAAAAFIELVSKLDEAKSRGSD